jgi:hypothetical protein
LLELLILTVSTLVEDELLAFLLYNYNSSLSLFSI